MGDKIEPKKKIGRPTKYRPEICDEMIKYFSIPSEREVQVMTVDKLGNEIITTKKEANPMPSFADFAIRVLDVNVDTLNEWCKVHPEFSEVYKKCKQLQEQFLTKNALAGYYQPATFIFIAKNITSLRDKTEVEHSGELNISHILDSIEQRKNKVIEVESEQPKQLTSGDNG